MAKGRPIGKVPYSLRPFVDVFDVRGGSQGWWINCRVCETAGWLPRAECRPGTKFLTELAAHAERHRVASLTNGR